MKISELIESLEQIRQKHGDVYVSIRHAASCEFGPDDDLTDIRSARYDVETNTAVIRVVN